MKCSCQRAISLDTCVLDLPSLVFPGSIRSESNMDLVTSCVNATWWNWSTERSILLSSCWNLEKGEHRLRNRDVYSLNVWLIYAKSNLNMQETAWSYSISPKDDKWVTYCLHKHEDEYIAYLSPVCVMFWSHITNLQHIVWTGGIWMSLYVKGFQEVQDYSVALWQMNGVVTLTHGWVGTGVALTGQNSRQWGQHLAAAWHYREDSLKSHSVLKHVLDILSSPQVFKTSESSCECW